MSWLLGWLAPLYLAVFGFYCKRGYCLQFYLYFRIVINFYPFFNFFNFFFNFFKNKYFYIMSEKRYCFIPEEYKVVNVYNAGSILDVSALKSIIPALKFNYCNDPYEKVKIFYVEGHSDEHAKDTEEYFRYKTVQAILSLFKIDDIYDYKLVMDENARLEFTIFYDAFGNHIPTKNVVEKNKRNTILAHRYTYIFYKRYN